jgi:hypothetical protein
MSGGSRALPGVQAAEVPGDSAPIRLRTGIQGHKTRLLTLGSPQAPLSSGEPELRKVTRPGMASRHPGVLLAKYTPSLGAQGSRGADPDLDRRPHLSAGEPT